MPAKKNDKEGESKVAAAECLALDASDVSLDFVAKDFTVENSSKEFPDDIVLTEEGNILPANVTGTRKQPIKDLNASEESIDVQRGPTVEKYSSSNQP